MSGPCGVNPVTGYCDICQCFTAQKGDTNEFFCIGGEFDQQQNQRHRDEDELLPEQELEFKL